VPCHGLCQQDRTLSASTARSGRTRDPPTMSRVTSLQRQKMLADVVKSVLPGRTRVELEQILGPSLETSYFKSSGRDLIYVLGPQRDSYFVIDSEWLLIWLDKDGRIERYAIAND